MSPKTFLFNKINSKKFRLNGIWPSSRLPTKRKLCQAFRDHVLYSANQLPHKVDFRNDMTPVEDQSKIGSCAANCLAGAYEYLTKKSDGRNTDVSRLFIYYNARAKDNRGRSLTDSGCSMTSAIEALEEFGTCLESIWPYEVSKVNSRPSDRAFDEAKNHTITEALQIDIDLNEMKSCLAQGFPFAFGLRLFRSFDKASRTGVVPVPNSSDRVRSSHGSHALLAVGYSDHSRSFIVRNSWGEDWGDSGYCYIPYEYMTNPELCFDAWAVRKLATDNFSTEHWDNVDAVNYLKAAIIAVMSMDNNNDDNSEIKEVDEEDDTNDYERQRQDNSNVYPGYNNPLPPPPPHGQQQQYADYRSKPQSEWTAADYYQHETGFNANNNFGNQFQGSYSNNNPQYPAYNYPPNNTNQQFGPGYGHNNSNYGYRY